MRSLFELLDSWTLAAVGNYAALRGPVDSFVTASIDMKLWVLIELPTTCLAMS